MYTRILFFLLFINIQSFSQEKTALTIKDIYTKNDLTYKVINDSIFTGSIEFRRWSNNILLAKQDYKDGFIILLTEYYNKSKKGIPSRKTYYYDHQFFKKRRTDRLDFDGSIDSSIYFDENENKIVEEFFDKGKLSYSCEYKDGKKNGKEFCLAKNGEAINSIYQNGKKVK